MQLSVGRMYGNHFLSKTCEVPKVIFVVMGLMYEERLSRHLSSSLCTLTLDTHATIEKIIQVEEMQWSKFNGCMGH